jgi:hypothetical protein
MRIRRIRLRKEYRLKAWLFILITFSLCFIFIPKSNRAVMFSFFSKKCRNYQQVYSRKLNDRITDYTYHARLTGIEKCSDANDIGERISSRQLFRVKSGRRYKVENMAYSYPYLTRDSKKLLDEIGKRFKKKVKRDGLMGSRFIITSMIRTSEKIKDLGKINTNASDNSPHLNGNAFDISYARFSFRKLHVTECDRWYMKEALAEVIWQLKQENQCWATYERNQGCFHVVSR